MPPPLGLVIKRNLGPGVLSESRTNAAVSAVPVMELHGAAGFDRS